MSGLWAMQCFISMLLSDDIMVCGVSSTLKAHHGGGSYFDGLVPW